MQLSRFCAIYSTTEENLLGVGAMVTDTNHRYLHTISKATTIAAVATRIFAWLAYTHPSDFLESVVIFEEEGEVLV